MAKALFTGIKSLTSVWLKTSTGVPANDKLLQLPTPSNGKYSTGIEEFEIEAVSECTGERYVADTYVVKRAPTFALTYGAKNKQLLSAFFGLALANGTRDTAVVKTLEVTSGVQAATISGYSGFGVTADQSGSEAFYLNANGVAVELTRQTFATFNGATALSWAQGADLALKWSDDLVANRNYVTYYVPYSSTNTDYLTATTQANYSADLFFIDTDGKVGHFIFPSITANLTENKEFEFGGGTIDLNFRVTGEVYLRYPNRLATC
jgi:hypothetical protein